VSTLSGGESFIVSLSLALGLSELASQKISIDSLFLDEGFGTLDEDSLETALNALNLLQSSGKMVGVISHVEALKERIPLQIKVMPKGDGTSFVELGWGLSVIVHREYKNLRSQFVTLSLDVDTILGKHMKWLMYNKIILRYN